MFSKKYEIKLYFTVEIFFIIYNRYNKVMIVYQR